MERPILSVVVPTRDRCEAVLRLLRALALQQDADGAFEVIVVDDGSSDRTADRVRATHWPFAVHVLEQPATGPATARNCGAALAEGDVLLFLDDDVEPLPEVVRTHVALHKGRAAERPGAVGLGYLPPVVPRGLFGMALRGWWESMFDGPRRRGHRYTFRDFLSGHVSIRRADFVALGGFDCSLTCHEDWELGYRAIAAGLEFTFLPAAVAWHHEATDLAKALRRKFDEGSADVRLARRFPELVAVLPIGWSGAEVFNRSRLVRLAWEHPATADRAAAALARVLPLLERWRLRFRWRSVVERLLTYWYWRGVAHEVRSRDALRTLLAEVPAPQPSSLTIDLAHGVDAAAARLDAERPRSVRLVCGPDPVGTIPDVPGSERLRGGHLVEALAGPLAESFAAVLARRGEMPAPIAAAVLRRGSHAAPDAVPARPVSAA